MVRLPPVPKIDGVVHAQLATHNESDWDIALSVRFVSASIPCMYRYRFERVGIDWLRNLPGYWRWGSHRWEADVDGQKDPQHWYFPSRDRTGEYTKVPGTESHLNLR